MANRNLVAHPFGAFVSIRGSQAYSSIGLIRRVRMKLHLFARLN